MAAVNFVSELNNQLGNPMSDDTLAELLASCAGHVLQSAIAGDEIEDSLNREQTGLILVVLQWNHNPVVRRSVKQR